MGKDQVWHSEMIPPIHDVPEIWLVGPWAAANQTSSRIESQTREKYSNATLSSHPYANFSTSTLGCSMLQLVIFCRTHVQLCASRIQQDPAG